MNKQNLRLMCQAISFKLARPGPKTKEMTEPVGVDADGRLWTKGQSYGYDVEYPAVSISWDGTIGDRETVNLGNASFVRVSDLTPTLFELCNSTVSAVLSGAEMEYGPFEAAGLGQGDGYTMIGEFILVIYRPITVLDVYWEHPGVYMMYVDSETYCRSLTHPDITEEVQIPAKYVDLSNVYDTATVEHEYSWTGDTDGREYFIYNGFEYYKVSDDAVAFDAVKSACAINQNNSQDYGELRSGDGCYAGGAGWIVATRAGDCALQLEGTSTTIGFSSPGIGVYLRLHGAVWTKSLHLSAKHQIIKLRNSLGDECGLWLGANGVVSSVELH